MAAAAVKAGYWLADSGNLGDINPTLFTHLFCAFADVHPVFYEVVIPEASRSEFANFSATVKGKNPSVKTLLSIGGNDPTVLASMASSHASRQAFIYSSIAMARNNNFDGLDLFWEKPASEQDMANLSDLVGEWLAQVAADAGPTSLLLTAAAFSYPAPLPYPGPAMQQLDWVNVMAIDLTYPNSHPRATGAPAALFNPNSPRLCGNGLVTELMLDGLGHDRLVLCLPFYGYAWKLSAPNDNGRGALADGPYPGPRYLADGLWFYSRIKQLLPQMHNEYDNQVVSDYSYREKLWVGFDGRQSIHAKIQWAKTEMDLRGYVAWTVAWDSPAPDSQLSRAAYADWEAEA